MSNRLFQGIIHQMHDSIGRTVGVVDDCSSVVACSDLARTGERNDFLATDYGSTEECHVRDGFTYKTFGSDEKPEFAVFVAGIMVDFVRDCIFKVVIRGWKKVFAGKDAVCMKES